MNDVLLICIDQIPFGRVRDLGNVTHQRIFYIRHATLFPVHAHIVSLQTSLSVNECEHTKQPVTVHLKYGGSGVLRLCVRLIKCLHLLIIFHAAIVCHADITRFSQKSHHLTAVLLAKISDIGGIGCTLHQFLILVLLAERLGGCQNRILQFILFCFCEQAVLCVRKIPQGFVRPALQILLPINLLPLGLCQAFSAPPCLICSIKHSV